MKAVRAPPEGVRWERWTGQDGLAWPGRECRPVRAPVGTGARPGGPFTLGEM